MLHEQIVDMILSYLNIFFPKFSNPTLKGEQDY